MYLSVEPNKRTSLSFSQFGPVGAFEQICSAAHIRSIHTQTRKKRCLNRLSLSRLNHRWPAVAAVRTHPSQRLGQAVAAPDTSHGRRTDGSRLDAADNHNRIPLSSEPHRPPIQ